MARWDKETFMKELAGNSSREVTKIGKRLCDFTEECADIAAWGKGKEYGTISFKTKSDFGLISLLQMTSKGNIKFLVNNLRQKNVPKPIIKDFVIKLESNFLIDYDEENYPVDTFEDIGELFHTEAQVEKLIQTIEGVAYRLRQ